MQHSNLQIPLQALHNDPAGRQEGYTVHFGNYLKEPAKARTFLVQKET